MENIGIKVTEREGGTCIIPWSRVLYVADKKIIVDFALRSGSAAQNFYIKESAEQIYAQLP